MRIGMARRPHGVIAVFATAVLALFILAGQCYAQFPPIYLPLFQCQVFYNLDLDMSPGNVMVFTGPVFCNSNIWCYPGGGIDFESTVEAGGNYFFHWDTNGDQSANISSSPNPPIFNGGG